MVGGWTLVKLISVSLFLCKKGLMLIIQKFTPICLLPVLFKLFPKFMDEMAKPFVEKLIFVSQNAFTRGGTSWMKLFLYMKTYMNQKE